MGRFFLRLQMMKGISGKGGVGEESFPFPRPILAFPGDGSFLDFGLIIAHPSLLPPETVSELKFVAAGFSLREKFPLKIAVPPWRDYNDLVLSLILRHSLSDGEG